MSAGTKEDAERRRRLAKNPGVEPELRWYIDKLNSGLGQNTFGTTTTTTTSTTSTTTTGA